MVDSDGPITTMSTVVPADLARQALTELSRSEHLERILREQRGFHSGEELPDVLRPMPCRVVGAGRQPC